MQNERLRKDPASPELSAGDAGAPDEPATAWRELATETVRNLSSLVEEAQAMLRRAEEQLHALNSADPAEDSELEITLGFSGELKNGSC